MLNNTLPITFGVELELVFAFHETLLQAHLDKGNVGAPIVKDIASKVRKYLSRAPLQYSQTITEYTSWALTGRSSHALAKRSHDGKIRCYGDEPLQLAHAVLPSQLAYVHDDRDHVMDFTQWHLTNDSSLSGVDKATLVRKLGDRIPDVAAAYNWDSYGLELVSRVLPVTDASFTEISTMITALKGTPTSLHGAFPTPLCGLHVHVGLPSSPIPLPTLQHLAYILTMYEPQISAMHPAHRREGSSAANVDIASNRDAFLLDPAKVVKKLVFNPLTRSATRKNRWVTMMSLDQIRKQIFAPGITLKGVVDLMGNMKTHIVNWSYLLRGPTDGPTTLEFRQHEGCLYGPSVKWWVLFVTGLVRLADHLAGISTTDAVTGETNAGVVGYVFHEWHDNMSYVDLFEMMGFPEEGRRWLGGQVAYHAGTDGGTKREVTPVSDDEEGGDGGEGGKGAVLGKRDRDDDGDGDDWGVRLPPALR